MAIKTFTTGEVLTASDTNTYLANSGLVYVTGASFTTQTSVPVSDCFTSTAVNYRVIIAIDTVNSSAGRTINLRFRTASGDDANAIYTYSSANAGFGSTTLNNNLSGYSQTESKLTNHYYLGNTSSATLDILQPFVSTKRTMASGLVRGGTASEDTQGFFGLSIDTAKSHTGFTFYASAGNMTGSYYVYAYRNA